MINITACSLPGNTVTQQRGKIKGTASVCVCVSVCDGASSFDVPSLSTGSNSNLHGNRCAKTEKMILADAYVCEQDMLA